MYQASQKKMAKALAAMVSCCWALLEPATWKRGGGDGHALSAYLKASKCYGENLAKMAKEERK